MTNTQTLYKILGPDRQPCHRGRGQWPEPGAWREVDGPLVPCQNALHLCEAADLPRWIQRDAVVWEAEADGEQERHDDTKTVARRARLVREIGVLHHRLLVAWAADCAERVLPLFEAERPHDSRPRDALAAVRRWLVGDGSIEEVIIARITAVGTYAANVIYAVTYAANATYVTNAATTAANEREERQWQGERLLAYLSGTIVLPGETGR